MGLRLPFATGPAGPQGIQGQPGAAGAAGPAGPSGTGSLPTGTILSFAGNAAPIGFLLCDGAAVKRSDYTDLWNLLGTAYGPGDGTTTFNLPDMRGRFVLGAGQGQNLTKRTLGATGGEESHALTIPEIPAHRHVDPYSEHGEGSISASCNGFEYVPGTTGMKGSNSTDYDNGLYYGGYEGGSGYASAVHASKPTTPCEPHSTMPPFVVLNHIIKA